MPFDPCADLEMPVGIEELRGHGDQLRDLALVVLELEDLRVALEIVEVVDRAHWELALQVSAHDRDLRLVQRWLVEELPPGRREVALGAEIAPRPAVPGGNALGQIALRVEVEPLRHDAGIGAGSWFRLGSWRITICGSSRGTTSGSSGGTTIGSASGTTFGSSCRTIGSSTIGCSTT